MCARMNFDDEARLLAGDESNVMQQTLTQTDDLQRGEDASAALVNGVGRLRGNETARAYRRVFERLRPSVKNLAALSRWMFVVLEHLPAEHHGRVELRKVEKRCRKQFEEGDKFAWLAASNRMWVVRLYQAQKVDHCILVDGSRKLIYDSAERVPIELTPDALRYCGGPRVPKLEVKEVRELVSQRERCGKRKMHQKEVIDLT